MKYSQAILVACVGGATLASAIPTPSDSGAELNARGPADKNIGMRLGKAVAYGGGLNSYNRRGPSAHPAKGQSLDNHNPVADPASADPASQVALPAGGKGKGKGGKRGKKTKLTDAERQQRKEAGAKMSPAEKAKARQDRKAKKASAGAVAASGGAEATTPPPTTTEEPVVARDFDEDLFSRAFEDELEARGFFSNLKENYRQNKAESLQKKLAATPVYKREIDARDFDDELSMRDLEDELAARGLFSGAFKAVKSRLRGSKPGVPTEDPTMSQRDFFDDDSLSMRDFEDELAARGLLSGAFKAVKSRLRGSKPSIPTGDPTMSQRDFIDEDSLSMRDFDDELAARGLFSGAFKAVKSRLRGSKPGVPTEDPTMSQRDFFDEDSLFMRDFEDELAARGLFSGAFKAVKSRLRGSKPGVPTEDPTMSQRDFIDDDTLALRDLEEILSSRDFEEELAARGIRDGFRALKDTLRGSRKPKGGVDPSMDPTLVQRDFEDFIDARDLEDELAARGIRDGFRALKDTLRGSRKGVQPPVDPTLMQRDFFEALDTREINELD